MSINCFFLCQNQSGKQLDFDEHEILNVHYFDQNNLPSLSEGRVNQYQIDLCFKHFKTPALPTEFD